MRNQLKILLVLYIFAKSSSEKWVDPNDPTAGRRLASKNEIAAKPTDVCGKGDNSCKLLVREILLNIHVSPEVTTSVSRNVKFWLNAHGMSVISKYLNGNEDTAADREKLRAVLASAFSEIPTDPTDTYMELLQFLQPYIMVANIILLPISGFFVLMNIMRTRRFLVFVILVAFFISVFNTYSLKYQEGESRRFAAFQEQLSSGDQCVAEGIFARALDILASPFQFKQKTKCLRYIESQTISIFNEISLLEVISEVIAGAIYKPLSVSGKYINLFFRELYEGTPLLAQITMTVFVILMVGRVKTPFFSYEPLLLTAVPSMAAKVILWFNEETAQIGQIAHGEALQQLHPVKSENLLTGGEAPLRISNLEFVTSSTDVQPLCEEMQHLSIEAPEDSSQCSSQFECIESLNIDEEDDLEREECRLNNESSPEKVDTNTTGTKKSTPSKNEPASSKEEKEGLIIGPEKDTHNCEHDNSRHSELDESL